MHLQCSPKLDVTIINATLSVRVQLGESGGYPTIQASKCRLINISYQSFELWNRSVHS